MIGVESGLGMGLLFAGIGWVIFDWAWGQAEFWDVVYANPDIGYPSYVRVMWDTMDIAGADKEDASIECRWYYMKGYSNYELKVTARVGYSFVGTGYGLTTVTMTKYIHV